MFRDRTFRLAVFKVGRLHSCTGLTLVEVLVVIGIIGLLMAILFPALRQARIAAQSIQCSSNLHQIVMACMMYANDNDGSWPPGAADMYAWPTLDRWHGSRPDDRTPFDFDRDPSPLHPYLVAGIKRCPALHDSDVIHTFESGAGGYGYNNAYLGSRINDAGLNPTASDYATPAKMVQVRDSSNKIAFADVVTPYSYPLGAGLFEYSFVEPPFTPWGPNTPSIHFRHDGHANVAWADGHVTSERFEWTLAQADISPWLPGLTENFLRQAQIGWFGPHDNSLFQKQ
jgi:prepilin-type processing-associated H-X9-DG protein/prepilin-type N-terminal cleavage/methylation domain-containing protein